MVDWQMKVAYETKSGESWSDAAPFVRELWENAWVAASKPAAQTSPKIIDPPITRDARVGDTVFTAGVRSSWVVRAAQELAASPAAPAQSAQPETDLVLRCKELEELATRRESEQTALNRLANTYRKDISAHDRKAMAMNQTHHEAMRFVIAAAQPSQPVEAGEPFPYQKTFDAVAAATSVSAGRVAISVIKFREAFGAAPSAVVLDDERAAIPTHDDDRENVEDVLAIVRSYGPYGRDINEALRFQIVLADEVRCLRALYLSAVKGRADFRSALREARAASPQPVAQTERALTDEARNALELAAQVLRQIEAGDGVFVSQCAEAIEGLEVLLTAAQPASDRSKQ